MRRNWFQTLAILLFALALVAAACAKEESEPANGGGGGGNDLLAAIMERGTLRLATDPLYPPQSSLNEETGQWEGFDIDVATEIATRMGDLQVEWKTPSWNAITSGNWNDRWDLSVGSMTVTPERAEVLDFTTPYYYTPAAVAVHEDNTTVTDVSTDLDGKKVGVCQACTYDSYLQKSLEIPGETFDFVIDDAEIVTYSTDALAIKDLELGDGVRLDAAISALPTLEGAIDKGSPIKIAGDPVFYEPLAAAIDKGASLDPTSFVEKVSSIIEEMHQDGTLTELSMKWYETDLTAKVES